MKRVLTIALCFVMLLGMLPASAVAKSNQMQEGVPVWTEDTIRQYALDYISGTEMSRLWGYYDLQIRRYMPQQAYENLMIDLEFLTGDFQELGSYRSFEEPENQLKVHVLHLCMEKLDLDMYLTHKNKEDDWEVMALEFAPAEEELSEEIPSIYEGAFAETPVTVGTSVYPLDGVLTMPASASAETPVPACVFVHDFGAYDRDHTLGETKLFSDFAGELAEMGIASVRYDKRTFAYPEVQIETVWDEVVEDALSAVNLLKADERVDQQRIVVVGLGLGAMTAPRIAAQSEGSLTGMIMIGSTPDSIIEAEFERADDYLATLTSDELDNEKYIIRNFNNVDEAESREMSVLGRNAYYYWEAGQYTQTRQIKKLAIPVFFAQGRRDPIVSEDDGRRAYVKEIGYSSYAEYEAFRGLNHLLMDDLTTDINGKPEYKVPTHLDKYAARTLANWILDLYQENE